LESAGVVIAVESIALAELSADALLANPLTACFAAGGKLESGDVGELCDRIVRTLADHQAGWEEWCMAVAAAGTVGRKDAMIRAMRRANEALIIEDLVDIGFDEGFEKGRREGVEQGRQEGVEQGRQEGVEQGRQEGVQQGLEEGRLSMAREALLELFGARDLQPSAEELVRIQSESSLEQLKRWMRLAAVSTSVAAALQ
jgi:hypothetical protein